MGYNTFTTMYNSVVVQVLDYGSSIWGYSKKNYQANLAQNKAIKYYFCDTLHMNS